MVKIGVLVFLLAFIIVGFFVRAEEQGLRISLDSTSPPLKLVQVGSRDETLLVLKLDAFAEDVDLQQIHLWTSSGLWDSPVSLFKISLWEGSRKVGEALTLSEDLIVPLDNFVIPAGSSKRLTVKGDFYRESSGAVVKVGWRGDNAVRNDLGEVVGWEIVGPQGVMVVKSVPKFSAIPVPGRLLSGPDQVLYRFKVESSEQGRGISLARFSFGLASKDVFVGAVRLYCYSDSGFVKKSERPGGLISWGLLNVYNASTGISFYPVSEPSASGASGQVIRIPPGESRWFELRGDVSHITSDDASLQTIFYGDSKWSVAQFPPTDLPSTRFVWCDKVDCAIGSDLWMSGFLVPGLPEKTAPQIKVR